MAYLAEYNPKGRRYNTPVWYGECQPIRILVVIWFFPYNYDLEVIKRAFAKGSEQIRSAGIHISLPIVEAISFLSHLTQNRFQAVLSTDLGCYRKA